MLFITTQPDTDYYIWQLQVQLNNFKKFGSEDKCVVIFGYNPKLGVNPNALEFEEKTHAKVLFYPDTRDLSMRLYLPSIRPHLLKQLYQNNPEIITNKNYLYLDCDILFADYPDFSELNSDRSIYVSPTPSEFSIDYIKTRNMDLFHNMCKTVGITSHVVDKNQSTGGGIVYLIKYFHYLDFAFWDKVERDSIALYKMMLVTVNKDSYIQIMTANKWAMLWNLWLIGYDTKVTDEFSISWANDPVEEWNKHKLYNNAGVNAEEKSILFYKGDFINKTPFGEDLSYISDRYCSFKYVEEITSTGKALNSVNKYLF